MDPVPGNPGFPRESQTSAIHYDNKNRFPENWLQIPSFDRMYQDVPYWDIKVKNDAVTNLKWKLMYISQYSYLKNKVLVTKLIRKYR